jgi:hypothetical protein
MKPAFNECHQFPQGKLGLGVLARDDLPLCPIFLQRGRSSTVGVGEELGLGVLARDDLLQGQSENEEVT